MVLVVASLLIGQTQGPLKEPGATVARPRNSTDSTTGKDAELPKIPSKLKKDPQLNKGGDVARFQTDVDIVTIDAAVIDNKGRFIPGIPAGNFRILEDNVPQQIRKVDMGEAPLTIAMVIEFSNRFQRYYSYTWFQTLQLAWGFAESLKPEDYAAVVAYDMRTEILTDFTTDKAKIREGLDRLKIAAFNVGIGARCLEMALAYAKERVTFGQPIGSRQGIQWMLADSEVELMAARLLVQQAAWVADSHQPIRNEAFVAKLYATEMAQRVSDRALQIFGGMGYTREVPIQSFYRQVRVWRIGHGTSEIHRWMIARNMLKS